MAQKYKISEESILDELAHVGNWIIEQLKAHKFTENKLININALKQATCDKFPLIVQLVTKKNMNQLVDNVVFKIQKDGYFEVVNKESKKNG